MSEQGIHLGSQYADRLRRYTLSLAHPTIGETMAGVYDGSETFTATLDRGEGRAIDATVSAEWDAEVVGNPADLAVPQIKLTVDPGDLIYLTEYGLYNVRIWIDDVDIAVLNPAGTLEIYPPAGTAEAPRTYCSLDDVRDVCPWIESAIKAHPTAQIDLAEQRGLATEWIDSVAVNRYRVALMEQQKFGWLPFWASTTATQQATIASTDLTESGISTLVSAMHVALAANGLMVDVEVDSLVRRAAAYHTVYRILDPMRFHGESASAYANAADRFAMDARRLLNKATLRIDLDDDGIVDVELS